MEFRDYAAKETAALFTRLLASQAEASVQHLASLRDALDAATRGIEQSASTSPEVDQVAFTPSITRPVRASLPQPSSVPLSAANRTRQAVTYSNCR